MARHRSHGGGGGGGGHGGGDARWLVTYADLLTLLMVLFLVLWVISTIDLKKFEEFKQGLGAFGNPAAAETVPSPGGASPPATGPLAGPGTADPATLTEPVPSTMPGVAPGSTVVPSSTATGESAPVSGPPPELDAGGLIAAAAEVEAVIAAAGLPAVIDVVTEERGLVVRIASDDVLFDSASAEVTPAGRAIVSVVAPSLLEFSNHIVVEGHTDKRPLRRTGYDNWDLSVDRAVSVIKMLRDDFGLPPDRLAAAGYGDQRPLDAGDSTEALARNRRVEIVVLAGPSA